MDDRCQAPTSLAAAVALSRSQKNIPDDKSENSVSDTPIEDKKFGSRGCS
jgi:hypothetical protein